MEKTTRLHEIETAVLGNGVRLVHIKSDLPIATISLWFDVGSRNDPMGKEGMTHFAEHLFMKATKEHPNASEIQSFHSVNGIRYNAMTGADTVHFQYETMADNVFFALRHFLDSASKCFISETAFDQESLVIAEERARKRRDPVRVLYDLTRASLFPGSRLAHSGLGTDESVRNITYADVLSFVKSKLSDGPKTFIVSSPYDIAAVMPYFSEVRGVDVTAKVEAEKLIGESVRLAVSKNDAKNVSVALGFRTCGFENMADRIALQCLAMAYLCSNMSSRLLVRLRNECQFTYAVLGQTQYFQETGAFAIKYSLSKEHVRESVAICREEIDKLRRGEIDLSALAAAKKMVQFKLLEQCLEPMTVAGWYAAQRREGNFSVTYDAFVAGVERLTPDDLARVANAYLTPERMSVALLGDVDDGMFGEGDLE